MEVDAPGPNPLFAVWRLARTVESLVETAVIDVSAADFGLLSQVRYGPQLSVSELAEATGSPLSTTSQQVSRLEDRGWVSLRRNPADGRSRLVGLTSLGLEVHEDAGRDFVALLGELRDVLGADEGAVMAGLARLEAAVRHVSDVGRAPDVDVPQVPAPLTLDQRAEVERFVDYVRWRDAAIVG